MTTVSQMNLKTSKSHDTRETGDLRTAADHQLWNTSVCCQKTVAGERGRARATHKRRQNPQFDSRNEGIARYTRNLRAQNRSGSSTFELNCVSVVKNQWRATSSDLKMTTVSQFDPKTNESHDTREIGDLRTAADHQLLNTTV